MEAQITNIDEVKEFFRMYFVTSINYDNIEFNVYYKKAEAHINRMFDCKDFCDKNGYAYHDLINEIKVETKGKKVVNLKVFINSVDDVKGYLRWMNNNFPIKHEYGTDEFEAIMDYHGLCLSEASDFCYENGLNITNIQDEVNQIMHDEEIAEMRELWFTLFPHYRPEAA